MLEVRNSSGKGRGVFTLRTIPKGEIFERSPIIEIPEEQIININNTIFYDYYFKWGENKKAGAIALGYGSLFNHSFQPNAQSVRNLEDMTIDFYALRQISEGEEITINYIGNNNDTKLGFIPID